VIKYTIFFTRAYIERRLNKWAGSHKMIDRQKMHQKLFDWLNKESD